MNHEVSGGVAVEVTLDEAAGPLRFASVGVGPMLRVSRLGGRLRVPSVLQVLIPTFLFVLVVQVLGLYVASFLLVAGFMRFIGRIALWKSLLTAFVFVAAMFWIFDVAFNVIMPKGPLEAVLRR